MGETVPRLLAENRYLVIATSDGDGRPWATPVFFAADGAHRVVWVSAPDSRHSRNIANRPEVAVTVFDSHAPIGGAEAVYLEATAAAVGGGGGGGDADGERTAALALLNARLPADKQLSRDDLEPAGPMRLYQATITRHYVLIRGGDSRFENVTDARLPVAPPEEAGS